MPFEYGDSCRLPAAVSRVLFRVMLASSLCLFLLCGCGGKLATLSHASLGDTVQYVVFGFEDYQADPRFEESFRIVDEEEIKEFVTKFETIAEVDAPVPDRQFSLLISPYFIGSDGRILCRTAIFGRFLAVSSGGRLRAAGRLDPPESQLVWGHSKAYSELIYETLKSKMPVYVRTQDENCRKRFGASLEEVLLATSPREDSDNGLKMSAEKAKRLLARAGVQYDSFAILEDGTCSITLSGEIQSLKHLQGLPVTDLNLMMCTNRVDLSGIGTLPIKRLRLEGVRFVDLQALENTKVQDLTLKGTYVRDPSALQDIPLTRLTIRGAWFRDLTPLRKLPLQRLDISHTGVDDLSPLRNCPLVHLVCDRERIKKGWDVVQRIPTLQTINNAAVK